MTIYVDELRDYGDKGKWCHMWSDTNDMKELNQFATKLGLSRDWIHRSSGMTGEFPHYDLRPNVRVRALNNGALEKSLREYIKQKFAKLESQEIQVMTNVTDEAAIVQEALATIGTETERNTAADSISQPEVIDTVNRHSNKVAVYSLNRHEQEVSVGSGHLSIYGFWSLKFIEVNTSFREIRLESRMNDINIGYQLTAAEARDLAHALLKAADVLELPENVNAYTGEVYTTPTTETTDDNTTGN